MILTDNGHPISNVAVTVAANGGKVTASQIAAAAASGAISGAIVTIAGPLGGSIAKMIGNSSAGKIAVGARAIISGAGAALGQTVANGADPCNKSSIVNAALLGGLGGGAVSKFFPTKGMYTLKQFSHFQPRSLMGLNRSHMHAGIGVSSGVGASANFF